MIVIDPYYIEGIVFDLIDCLHEAGKLEDVENEEPHGYTCEAVFGVRSDQIAAVHLENADHPAIRFFQLDDGRLIGSDPARQPVPLRLPPRSEH